MRPLQGTGSQFMGGGVAAEPGVPAYVEDAFTDTDATTLTAHDSDWVNNFGSFVINSNNLFAAAAGQISVAHYEGMTFANNQGAEATISVTGADGAVGVAVRCASGATATAYVFYVEAAVRYLFKYVAGVFSLIDSEVAAAGDGDAVTLTVEGTTLTPSVNSVTWGPGAKSDASIASGYPGVGGRVDAGGTDFALAEWFGADL